MPQANQRILSLMRDSSSHEEPSFIADLYLGNKVEDSMYLRRDEMLDWIKPLAPQARGNAAHALDLLMRQPLHTIIDIPLGLATGPTRQPAQAAVETMQGETRAAF